MIDTYLSYTDFILDAKCTSHIFNDLWRLKSRRKLRKGVVELRIGNDTRVATIVPWVMNPKLQSKDYVPHVVNKIISISCFNNMCYALSFKKRCCFIT